MDRRRAGGPARDPAAFDPWRFLAVVTLTGVGLGMTAPITALYASSFGAGSTMAGFAVSSVAVSLLAVDLFGTEVVPRLSGRTIFAGALAIFGVGSLASAAAPALWLVIAARVVQGVGAALFMGGALQVAVRHAPIGGAGRAIGSFNAAWFAGVAVGPLLGGSLAEIGSGRTGYRIAFLVCGGVCFAVAVTALVALPPLPSGRPVRLTRPKRARARPGLRMWPPLLLNTFGQAVRAGVVFTVLPLYGTEHLGLSTGLVGLALSALAVVDIVAMRWGGSLADRVGHRTVLGIALATGAVACALGSRVSSLGQFVPWCAALGITIGVAWVVPTAMVVDVAADAEVALVNARMAADVGQLFGSVVAGAIIAGLGYPPTVVVTGAAFAVVGLWTWRLPEARAAEPVPALVGPSVPVEPAPPG
jgi:MFS transporter, DHA1 family, multidrug resistance protein